MSKYLPRGLKLLDPRAMRQEDIVKFFKHISTRQISHGVRDAFRFKAVMTSRKGSNLDKTHYIDPLANPALLVMDPLDTEPNPASPSGHVPALPSAYSDLNPAPTYEPVPALPPVQRVFTSVFSIGDPSAIGGQSNPPEVTPNLTANTTRTARGRPEQHAFDNAGDDNQETTERRPRPRPRPTARGGKKVQGHASENAGHIRETPRPERQALTFDPGHQWESHYDLDPSLDPGVELPSTSNTTELLTPWLTLTTDGSSVQTHTPTPAKSPRRKADMLAIDEAQSLIVKGKRRR
jgi:hypothetical protein